MVTTQKKRPPMDLNFHFQIQVTSYDEFTMLNNAIGW